MHVVPAACAQVVALKAAEKPIPEGFSPRLVRALNRLATKEFAPTVRRARAAPARALPCLLPAAPDLVPSANRQAKPWRPTLAAAGPASCAGQRTACARTRCNHGARPPACRWRRA